MYKKSRVLKELRRALLEGAQLKIACVRAGLKNEGTLFVWRKRKMIDGYVSECMRRGNEKRTDAVEDGLFKSLIESRASAAAYEFYLTNRRPEKWKKRSEIINNNTNIVKVTVNPVKDLRDEELDGIISNALKR